MQAQLATSQLRVSHLPRPPFGRLSSPAALTIAVLVALSSFVNPGYCSEIERADFQKLFHLVGIPGLRRDERVNLIPDSDGLLFQTKKVQYHVPYARIHRVLLLPADRRYEGRTYAAAVATYGVGSLLILKKHHVDTIVLDYVNERGGKMGIVVQMETAQGEHFKDVLKLRGVPVVEPEGFSESLPKQETGNDVTDRSKP